ncbi:MAG: class I SAM-dependent methyltransferase [Spartobacteria bacterium]
MSFDRVAPHYRWLETLVFGRQLQHARTSFVREVDRSRRVLVAGEGDGRFLEEFVRAHPGAAIDCVEASARMIELARARAGLETVNFILSGIHEVALPVASYDLIVTHFFLDCFEEDALARVIEKLARAATVDAAWLIADFHPPRSGWRRWWARSLIAVMYWFFRSTAGIEACRLVDYHPLLYEEGFTLAHQATSPNEMIISEWWRRGDQAICHSEPAERGEGPRGCH